MRTPFLLLTFLLLTFFAQAQSPVGVWRTIDDATQQPKSEVQIYEQNGVLYGKVIKLLRKGADANTLCTKCTDSRKNQPVLNMVIMNGLKASGKEWKDGKIIDPEKGVEYTCKIWFKDGNANELSLRGYHWTGLYRTQTWYRVR